MAIIAVMLIFGLLHTSVLCQRGDVPQQNCDGYHNGQLWEPQPCEQCECKEGEKICFTPSCSTKVLCSTPTRNGACCPACGPNAVYPACDGHRNGERWEPISCEQCKCVRGRAECSTPNCGEVLCSNPVQEGACCPECGPDAVYPACDDHRNGESWELQSCENCTCNLGEKICIIPSCDQVLCSNPVQEGSCCPECGPDAVYPACDGHSNGESWEPIPCERCTCQEGRAECSTPTCGEVLCSNPVQEGACCPECGPDAVYPACDDHRNGESWELQACENCTCNLGEKISVTPSCNQVLCSNPVQEGSCCPECGPDAVYPACDGHRNGEQWEPQPCEDCTCVGGRKVCISPTCVVQCTTPVPQEGACCPTCPPSSDCD